MNSRSLARLAALTQGAALVGAGVLACGGSGAPAGGDLSNSPSAFTLTNLAPVDSGATDLSTVSDASIATPSVDAVPSTIVDAGPGPLLETNSNDASDVDGGHRRHRFPTPNAIPRHPGHDGGL